MNRLHFAVLAGAENVNGLCVYYDAVGPGLDHELFTIIFGR